jgi:uncharacterized protein (DUF433 family)
MLAISKPEAVMDDMNEVRNAEIDWSQCEDVGLVPGKVSGRWIVVGTRILAQGVIDNADEYSPDEIATELFPGLGVERARRTVTYARGRGGAFSMVMGDASLTHPTAPVVGHQAGLPRFARNDGVAVIVCSG